MMESLTKLNCPCLREKAVKAMYKGMNLMTIPLSRWGLSHVEIHDDADILDIGCGGGRNIQRLLRAAPKGHVTGIDPSETAVSMSFALNREAIADGRCDVYEGTADILPFGDNRFDLVMASETMYFWKNPDECVREILRVLKPGGIFLAVNSKGGTCPLDDIYEKIIPGMKIFHQEELEELFLNAGFRDLYTDYKLGALALTAVKPMTKLDAVRKRLLLKEPASYGKIAIMAGILALIGVAIAAGSKKKE